MVFTIGFHEFVKAIWGNQCQAEEPEVEDIQPTDAELLRALINLMEEKRTIQKGDIFNKVKEMRE